MKPDIENLVKEKEQYLLDKYFGNLLKEAIDDSIQTSATTPPIFRLRSRANFGNISKSSGKNIPTSH